MKRLATVFLAAALTAVHAAPAWAWNDAGHMLVAQIAWDNMTPAARANAIRLLRSAGADTRLVFPLGVGMLNPLEQQQQFLHAAIWPDSMRGTGFDIPDRHFVNIFWRQDHDFSLIQQLPNHPVTGRLLADLPQLEAAIRNQTGTSAERAIQLAWIIHLVGDIHQPLHASSRITALEPGGDGGGGSYHLRNQPKLTLHNVWDRIVSMRVRHLPQEEHDEFAYVRRVATDLESNFPRTAFPGEISVTDPRQWAERSVAIAQQSVYRHPLQRNHVPSVTQYQDPALGIAEPRIALAGYRLADVLNGILG